MTFPDPTVNPWQRQILTAGLVSGHRGVFELACVLAKRKDLIPCEVCDYVTAGCRCEGGPTLKFKAPPQPNQEPPPNSVTKVVPVTYGDKVVGQAELHPDGSSTITLDDSPEAERVRKMLIGE